MHIESIEERPFHRLSHRNVAPGGTGVVIQELDFFRGRVAGLPRDLAGLLITSDLQGMELPRPGGPSPRFLGEVVAETVDAWCREGLSFPDPGRIGVILAGDFYVLPDLSRRGGLGDATAVWESFQDRFRWVAGVPGNHDLFGRSMADDRGFGRRPGIHLLDGRSVRIDGLALAGLGGIIGDPRKARRRESGRFLEILEELLQQESGAALILHEGPAVPEERLPGNPAIRTMLDGVENRLVICGHRHWSRPLVELPGGNQVLNVDHRVVFLVPPPPGAATRNASTRPSSGRALR